MYKMEQTFGEPHYTFLRCGCARGIDRIRENGLRENIPINVSSVKAGLFSLHIHHLAGVIVNVNRCHNQLVLAC